MWYPFQVVSNIFMTGFDWPIPCYIFHCTMVHIPYCKTYRGHSFEFWLSQEHMLPHLQRMETVTKFKSLDNVFLYLTEKEEQQSAKYVRRRGLSEITNSLDELGIGEYTNQLSFGSLQLSIER